MGFLSNLAGFNAGASESRSSGSSSAFSSGRTFIDPGQAPALDFTRNLAMGLAGQQLGGMGSLFGLAGGLGAQGQGLLGGIGAAQQGLLNFDNSAAQQAQIGQLGDELGAFFQNQILPGIGRTAVGVGGLGGSRQGVAQGIAAGEAARAFSGGVADIMSSGRAQQLAALQGAVGAGSAGIQGAGQLFGLGAAPFSAQFSPLLNLASIIGGPTVLSENQASSQSRTSSRSSSGSFGFGLF